MASDQRPARHAAATGIDDIARVFELSRDLLAVADASGRFVRLNPAWEATLGWSRDELMSRPALDYVHPEDVDSTLRLGRGHGEPPLSAERFENRYRCRDGGFRWLEWSAWKHDDRWYGVARDVTERKRIEAQALRDPLTALPNRTLFIDRLVQALGRLERRPGLVAVLFVDLDGFKVINDIRGHAVGDRVLQAAAGRLAQTVRGVDTVARFGGDEFVILIEDALPAEGLIEIARRVVDAFDAPFRMGEEEVAISASVGIAATDVARTAPEALLREADVAMYRAKGGGGGRCELFDSAMRAEVERRVRTQAELVHAIEHGELRVHYQPIVALPETSVVRCEALVRWEHPVRGLLPPGEFIPLAEESGVIVPLGEWVLVEACRQAQAWRRAGCDVGITVNVSVKQLTRPEFLGVVHRTLRETRLPAPALCLEITETAIVRRTERIAASLSALRRMGVQIAMDDFGSGYSSLTHLRSLALDTIKIDRSFVAGVPTSSEDRAIVAAILGLARETGLSVIAEGIETEALHAEIVRLGCDLGQGFLYDPPRPAAELALDGYSSRVRPGLGELSVVREFMRQIGIPARIAP